MTTCEILKDTKTVAVVGISGNPIKTSRMIADYLIDKGYKVVGVNPTKPEIDGIEVYEKLTDIPFQVDLVDVFRRSEAIPEIIPDVLEIKPKYLWLQLGIKNDEAVKPAIDANIVTVQNKCVKIELANC